ncbi:MAG: S8 family serine peptidase [Candidatus Cloacimonadales bacterium]|jgi:subtilisin family serine protease|nr:S8 family serine peptidase [Candidatus Cloacimonadota bacterium]MDD2651166.1 S8 family serine peptidase [Candidatus Cloacimonadota bacterium]MDX9976562.1 S8 family serine peptidase [Candidatus Cloacimonadales bacterium]
MKKINLLMILVLSVTFVFAADYEKFDEEHFFPDILNICFTKDFVTNTDGNLDYIIQNNVVQTQSDALNKIFQNYQVHSIKRLYQVKDRQWHRNGIYPMNIFEIGIKDKSQIENLYHELYGQPELIFVEYSPKYKLSYTPNDPLLISQWALKNIDAFRAWNYEIGDESIIVSVVDSGVKWNHPDLAQNMWINTAELEGVTINWETGEITGGDGIDNDGNGYVDDIFGWDFFATGDNEDNNPYQDYNGNDHGTHVAGCAAAVGDNAIGVVGPAYNVRIMATKHQPSNYGSSYIYNGYNGVYYSVDTGAHIINCSWGGRGAPEVANTAASYAVDHGSIMVCAASNDNTDNTYTNYYPSDATDAISVAATDQDDKKASFSNYGTPIDVSAPGVSILSTVYSMEGYNTYSAYQGTSMASPVAAGVAALIKSMHPELTPMQLKARLEAGCDNIDNINPNYMGKLGAGRVNAYNSLMFDKLPYIELDSYTINETVGNNDNLLNPGETVQVQISLTNRANWLPATNLTLSLRTNNPYITLIDSVFYLDSINPGQQVTSENYFSFSIDNEHPVIEESDFSINVKANTDDDYPYNDNLEFSVPITCMRANWPIDHESALMFPAVIEDINQNGENNIIFNDSFGNVYAMNKDANYLPGFPVALNHTSFAPVSIINQNQNKEIVVTAANKVFRISHTGEILSTFISEGNIRVSPVIYDQNFDGELDIIFSTQTGKVYSLKSDGQTLNEHFPISFDAAIVSPIAVGKSGYIYLAANNELLHSVSPDGQVNDTAPFPYNYRGVSMNGPIVISDLEGNEENIIICGNKTSGNRLSILKKGNEYVNIIPTSSAVLGGPIPLKNGEQTNYVFTTSDRLICSIDSNGNLVFSIQSEDFLNPSPLTVDINNDGIDEIMIAKTYGEIHFYTPAGELIEDKHLNINLENRLTPTLGSVDTEGFLDIISPSKKQINYLDTTIPFYSSNWSVTRANNQRTGLIEGFPLSNDQESPNFSDKFTMNNYPNPFNPITNIHLNLSKDTDCEVNVYNIKGQLVDQIFSGRLIKGSHTLQWNADKNKKSISSGIYFYQFKSNEVNTIKKMILLK